MEQYDAAIIGSGLSGVHAAHPLVAAKRKVIMIDGGFTPSVHKADSAQDFELFRTQSPSTVQRNLFFGEDLSGIAMPGLARAHSTSMLMGNKSYVSQSVKRLLPLDSGTTEILQTLARGGLSESWGSVCDVLDQSALVAMGLPSGAMAVHYRAVIRDIGVSGELPGYPVQEPVLCDIRASALLKKYKLLSDRRREGFVLKKPLLALLTRSHGERQATRYSDMDFWFNPLKSTYRASMTLEALMAHECFTYSGGQLVQKIIETQKGSHIVAASIDTNELHTFQAKKVILAAGAINTARILLESFGAYDAPLPLILKPHIRIPCIAPAFLGKADQRFKHSLCQLIIESLPDTAKNFTNLYAQLYSYRSLLLYKLLDGIPLPAPLACSFASLLQPSFMVADIRFGNQPSEASAKLVLKNEGRGKIVQVQRLQYNSTHESINNFKIFLRRIGLLPLMTQKTPLGSSAHYAGTVPFTDAPLAPCSTDQYGKVHQFNNVYIADSAPWRAVAPQPLGLTMMANARRIGTHVNLLL